MYQNRSIIMRTTITIHYNDRTRRVTMIEDSESDFNMIESDEAEEFFNIVQAKLKDKPWQRQNDSFSIETKTA